MNPYTGQTTPVNLDLAADKLLWREEQERAAEEVGLDDPDDLVLIEGRPQHVQSMSEAVKARAKAQRRAANKRARKQRKANR